MEVTGEANIWESLLVHFVKWYIRRVGGQTSLGRYPSYGAHITLL